MMPSVFGSKRATKFLACNASILFCLTMTITAMAEDSQYDEPAVKACRSVDRYKKGPYTCMSVSWQCSGKVSVAAIPSITGIRGTLSTDASIGNPAVFCENSASGEYYYGGACRDGDKACIKRRSSIRKYGSNDIASKNSNTQQLGAAGTTGRYQVSGQYCADGNCNPMNIIIEVKNRGYNFSGMEMPLNGAFKPGNLAKSTRQGYFSHFSEGQVTTQNNVVNVTLNYGQSYRATDWVSQDRYVTNYNFVFANNTCSFTHNLKWNRTYSKPVFGRMSEAGGGDLSNITCVKI